MKSMFEKISNHNPSLKEALRDTINDKSVGIERGYPDKFITVPEILYKEFEAIINKFYDFASQFQGHDYEDYNQEEDVNPLTIPLQSYLDFFAAASSVWGKSEAETKKFSKVGNILKRRKLEKIRESIGEDTERVVEVLLTSLAEVLMEFDMDTAFLYGQLLGALQAEDVAEDASLNMTTTYAFLASQPLISTPAIIGMASADEVEGGAEDYRVDITRQLLEKINPFLEKLNLKEAVEEWMFFSN